MWILKKRVVSPEKNKMNNNNALCTYTFLSRIDATDLEEQTNESSSWVKGFGRPFQQQNSLLWSTQKAVSLNNQNPSDDPSSWAQESLWHCSVYPSISCVQCTFFFLQFTDLQSKVQNIELIFAISNVNMISITNIYLLNGSTSTNKRHFFPLRWAHQPTHSPGILAFYYPQRRVV